MLLTRNADGKLGPSMRPTRSRSRATTTRVCRAPARFLDQMVDVAARGRHRRLPDRPRGRERPVRGQLHLRGCADDAPTTSSFVKMAASEIARQHGMIASFMPKPFSNRTGTGAHFHISIGDAKHEEPVPRRQATSAAWLCRRWATTSSAACCSTRARSPRSAHRRSTRTSGWSSAARCPARPGRRPTSRTATTTARHACAFPAAASRLRLPDGSAAIRISPPPRLLAAGLDGVERKLDPGEPNNTNLYEYSPAQTRRRRHRPAAAEPARGDRRAGADEVVMRCARRRTRQGVHQAEAHGMGRVLAPRVGLGNDDRYLEFLLMGHVPELVREHASCAESSDCW